MTRPLLFALCCGCASGSLEVSPNPLVWDEPVDFHDATPRECDGAEGGCAAQALNLTNTGSAELRVRIPAGFDESTICFVGFAADTLVEIPAIPPEATYSLQVSVCGYPTGSLESEVTGVISLTTDGKPEQLDVSFAYTPVRNIPVDDTGF